MKAVKKLLKRIKKSLQKEKGFTFVEVLVGAAILAILASVISYNALEFRKSVRDKQRINDLAQIELAMSLFQQDYGVIIREGLATFNTSLQQEIEAGVYDDLFNDPDLGIYWQLYYIGGNGRVGEGGFIDELLAPYMGGEVPHDPLGPGRDQYYYYYDGWHTCRNNFPNTSEHPDNEWKAVLYAGRMEKMDGNWADVCGGPGTEGGINEDSYTVLIGNVGFEYQPGANMPGGS